MDNPEDFLTAVESGVARLKVLHKERKKPLNDNVVEVTNLCEVLEGILHHQQKEHVSFWGDRQDYWNYLNTNVSGMKQLNDVVKKVQSLTHITTALGRGRVLIRTCLSEQCLAECFQHALNDKKRTREWYNTGAMLLSNKHSSRLLLALYDLSDVQFDLYDDTDLDEYWPSFQRKQFNKSAATTRHPPSSGGTLGNVLRPTKEATPDQSSRKKKSRRQLEHGREEQASEVFIKQDMTFDLHKVEEMVLEILNVVWEGRTTIPEISIPDPSHILVALNQLKDHVIKVTERHKECLKSLEVKVMDLELQLKDTLNTSEGSERDLLAQLHQSQSHIKLLDNQLAQSMNPDSVHQLEQEIATCHGKVEELENRNFELEEKILAYEEGRSSSPTPQWLQEERQDRKAAEEQMVARLAETEGVGLSLVAHAQHVQQCWVNESHTHFMVSAELSKLEQEVDHMYKEWTRLTKENERMALQLEENAEEHRKLQQKMGVAQMQYESQGKELIQLRVQLASHDSVKSLLQKERDLAQDELANMNSVLEQETASLKFQLSTVQMELAQERKVSQQQEAQVIQVNMERDKLLEELRSLKTHHQGVTTEQEHLLSQINELKDGLGGREAELKFLQEQLTEATRERDRERASNLKIKNDFTDTQERQQAEMKELNNTMQQLAKENSEIRQAFRKLLGQKVSLYEHADNLENDLTAMATGEWVDSGKVTSCMKCKQQFTLLLRKHHCRMCGQVFCNRCCDNKVKLTISKEPVRVCVRCHAVVMERRSSKVTADLINTDDPSIMESMIGQSNNMINDQRSERTYSANIKDMVSGSDEFERSHEEVVANDNSMPPSRQSQYSIQREDGQEVNIKKSNSASDEEDFVVINIGDGKPNQFPVGLDSPAEQSSLDVDALRSKLSQLETVDHPISSPTSSLPGSYQAKEPFCRSDNVELEGGGAHQVTIPVDIAGVVIIWEFNTEPKGIAFGITCQRDKNSPPIECLPIRRCSSHKTTLTGEYVAQTGGLYTLIFDNSNSKFSSRTLNYKVSTKRPY